MVYKIRLKLDQTMPFTFEMESKGSIIEDLVKALKGDNKEILKQIIDKSTQIGLEVNIFEDGKHYGEKYLLLESNGYRINDLEDDDE